MVFLLSSSNNLQVLQEASMLKTLQPRGVTMPDLRSEGSGNAKVQKSSKLAVRIGEIVTIDEDRLHTLPMGEYEELDSDRTIIVLGTEVTIKDKLRLRRTH